MPERERSVEVRRLIHRGVECRPEYDAYSRVDYGANEQHAVIDPDFLKRHQHLYCLRNSVLRRNRPLGFGQARNIGASQDLKTYPAAARRTMWRSEQSPVRDGSCSPHTPDLTNIAAAQFVR